jgi:hypothetical protein
MYISYKNALSQPEFDALVIRFRPPLTKDMAQQTGRLLATAVQQVLGTSVEGHPAR